MSKTKTITLELEDGEEFDIDVPVYNKTIKETLTMYILPNGRQVYYDCELEKFYFNFDDEDYQGEQIKPPTEL